MAFLGKEMEFETDDLMFSEDDEDWNAELEKEAAAMAQIWDRSQLIKEVNEERNLIAHNNKINNFEYYDGTTKFDELKKQMEPLHETKQVYIRILDPFPSGKQIHANQTLLFDRVGYLELESSPFESSAYDGKPIKINLAEGPILPGLLQAMVSLREGERAEILIHPAMAYGRLGCPPLIPANEWVLYYVKVHRVWDESDLQTLIDFEKDNYEDMPIEEKVALVEQHKIVANNYLRDGYHRDALIRYKVAVKCLDQLPEDQLHRSPVLTKLMTTLLTNAAITLNKLEMYKSGTKMAKRALFFDPKNIKAHYQLIKSRLGLHDYEKALNWLERATKMHPHSRCFDPLKLELDSKVQMDNDKRKEVFKKMSKACFS